MDKKFNRQNRALITMSRIRTGNSRFMDLKTDVGLKSTIGSEKSLVDPFINSCIKDKGDITILEILDKKVLGSRIESKTKIVDVLCESVLGGQFIVEILFINKPVGLDVVMLYTSKAFSNGLPKDKLDHIDAITADDDQIPVYFLALLDFELDNSTMNSYLHVAQFCETTTGAPFFDKLGYIFLELPRFTKNLLKGEDANNPSDVDKWIYTIKDLASLNENLPDFMKEPPFKELLVLSEVDTLPKKKFKKYEKCLGRLWDEEAIKGDGFDEGLKEGELKLEEAQKAHLQEKEEIIKKLLKLNTLEPAQIAAICAVEQKEVLKFQQSVPGSK